MGTDTASLRYGVILGFVIFAFTLAPSAQQQEDQARRDAARASRARVAAMLEARYSWFSLEDVELLAEVIVAEAQAAGLEPELVAAVIHVESSGQRFAVSEVGAMGLMQLLPNTAESVAPRAGVEWQGPATLFDPVSNVRLGVSYLDELVDRFGDLETALTAYNWGPTRIARRLREGGDLPAGYSKRVFRVYATLI